MDAKTAFLLLKLIFVISQSRSVRVFSARKNLIYAPKKDVKCATMPSK